MTKIRFWWVLAIAVLTCPLPAQSADTSAPASEVVRVNDAIIPAPREPTDIQIRISEVIQRAQRSAGPCDLVFIGDSITENWESDGQEVWKKHFGNRKCLNFGVRGDKTQHVLWRFEHGQLAGIHPEVAVVLIGTNNSDREDNTAAEMLAGVREVVRQVRTRLPETKVLLFAIFPRGKTFSSQRGKLLQVNQALAKIADGEKIFFADIGSRFIEPDGSISPAIMMDYAHLTERGYAIWAEAIEFQLKAMPGR